MRDAHELDLKTLEWKQVLSPNHESLRHEGTFGFINKYDLVLNWGGIIPSSKFDEEPIKVKSLSTWDLNDTKGFKELKFSGEDVPSEGGYFCTIDNLNYLLYIHPDGIWKLMINDL